MKAILEIDVPDSCERCKLKIYIPRGYPWPSQRMCSYLNKSADEFDENRHPDCPLKIVEDDDI